MAGERADRLPDDGPKHRAGVIMDHHNTETEAPAGKPAAPRLLGNRSEVVPLQYPVEYDGRVWTAITVSRMTLAQIRDFIADIARDADKARLPMFDAPPEVMDSLDPDDDDLIGEVVERFMPRRLRPADGLTPDSGASTSPSSEAS